MKTKILYLLMTATLVVNWIVIVKIFLSVLSLFHAPVQLASVSWNG